MKKKHKDLAVGGGIAVVTTILGTVFGEKILSFARGKGWLGSKIAGDDDMGSDEDPIIKIAKSL